MLTNKEYSQTGFIQIMKDLENLIHYYIWSGDQYKCQKREYLVKTVCWENVSDSNMHTENI